jgi:hypothetical protein
MHVEKQHMNGKTTLSYNSKHEEPLPQKALEIYLNHVNFTHFQNVWQFQNVCKYMKKVGKNLHPLRHNKDTIVFQRIHCSIHFQGLIL